MAKKPKAKTAKKAAKKSAAKKTPAPSKKEAQVKPAAKKKAPEPKAKVAPPSPAPEPPVEADLPADMSQLTQPRGNLLAIKNNGVVGIRMTVGKENRMLLPGKKILTMGVQFDGDRLDCQALHINEANVCVEDPCTILLNPGLVIVAEDNTVA